VWGLRLVSDSSLGGSCNLGCVQSSDFLLPFDFGDVPCVDLSFDIYDQCLYSPSLCYLGSVDGVTVIVKASFNFSCALELEFLFKVGFEDC
jgi:hypothetical protein